MNRMENIHYDAVMSHVIEAISPILNFSNGKVQKPDRLYHYEFQNLVLSLIQVMTEKNKVYQETLREIEVITSLIDKELKK